MYGVKGLASLDPFLGAPAISGAGKRFWSCGVVGLTVVLSAVRVRIMRILTGIHCFQTASVGADFWWSPRGALCSVALELLAVHWYVWLLWLLWWLDRGLLFSRNAWFDCEYMYCVCFLGLLEEFPFFYVKVFSGFRSRFSLGLPFC